MSLFAKIWARRAAVDELQADLDQLREILRMHESALRDIMAATTLEQAVDRAGGSLHGAGFFSMRRDVSY